MSGPLVRRLPTRSHQQFILGGRNPGQQNLYIKKKEIKNKNKKNRRKATLDFWANLSSASKDGKILLGKKKVDLKTFSKEKINFFFFFFFLQGAVGG